jgi:hypothetical protein
MLRFASLQSCHPETPAMYARSIEAEEAKAAIMCDALVQL